tara:strand:- start:798 stop:1244 length:447 start_codon:yes stop_codon:yes gene_type:complete
MANVNIKFNGKDFLLSCEDGQEEHLLELAEHLNKRFTELKLSLGNIGENKLLIISSISIMDEYFETKKRVDEQKKELENLKNKFKELKKLVYNYKDQKDEQILNLQNLQKNLKEKIDKSYSEYENTIDHATSKIENFLKKSNKDSPVQ